MSIHAQISLAAQAQLAAQKRNSTVSAIIIALLVCTLMAVILWIISLTSPFKNTEPTVTYNTASTTDEPTTTTNMVNEVVSNPPPPASQLNRVLSADISSPTAVPVSTIIPSEPNITFGNSDEGFEDGYGSSGFSGNGANSFSMNQAISKRCSAQDRIQRLTKEGGKASYEDQVVNALRWLKKTQASNGSWKAQGKPVAMTGLALLAYLGHCETPQSAEFGETVQNAIIYLINVSNKNSGKLATNTDDNHWCYEHAIATYALAEAYSLCKEFKLPMPGLEKAVTTAGNHIINNQHPSGGWDYAYDTTGKRGGDTSIVCWHLQALKACKMTDLEFKDIEKCAKNGIKYLEGAKNGRGTIGYGTNGKNLGHGPTMTPGAALCLQQWKHGQRSS